MINLVQLNTDKDQDTSQNFLIYFEENFDGHI